MPRPSTNRSTVPRRNGEPDQGMPARSVGRPHLDRDNGRQPAAAVVLVVRLRAARGPCAGSVCRTPSWRKRPAAASARSCSNSAPASPSPSGASRSPSPRPARTTPTSPRRMPGCAHRPAEPEAPRRRANDPHSRGRPCRTRYGCGPPRHAATPRNRRLHGRGGSEHSSMPPDLTPRPPRYPRFGEISGLVLPSPFYSAALGNLHAGGLRKMRNQVSLCRLLKLRG